MLKNPNLLIEIGSEEIPAGYILPAMESIKKELVQKFNDLRIKFDDIEIYSTPRRIAVLVSGTAPKQDEAVMELKGPSVKAAYNAQGPTEALIGFMNANGLQESDLFKKDTGKAEYVFSTVKLKSQNTEELLPDIVSEIIKTTPFPKRMKWSDKSITYPRPLRYFVLMFNDKPINFELDGVISSNKTRGHFIQNDEMIEIKKISDYIELLRNAKVIVDHNERKELIIKLLENAAKELGYTLIEDEELLNTVTFLNEYPYIVACEFKPEFLQVPDIALIAEMREHQKYFALKDKNKLVNKFLVISNNPPTQNIKNGNERVITARFNDAKFFYTEDRKTPLIDLVDSLKSVLFHKELGTIYDKVERMLKITKLLCDSMKLDDEKRRQIERAVLLCKTDLNTAMVYEFASLQGKIGKIYARLDGEDKAVAEAIENHYKPKFHGDDLPSDSVSICISLAEKIDNLFGSFSVGNIPKGSTDPYALRRQAGAVVDIVIKNEINIDMNEILIGISNNYKTGDQLIDKLNDFIKTRAKTIFTESGFAYDEIDACLSLKGADFFELFKRAKSINEFRTDTKFSEMLSGFKRMNNIVANFRKTNSAYSLNFDKSLLNTKEEKELFDFFDSKKNEIETCIKQSHYIDLFKMLIESKSLIDSFFDKVMVMDENIALRDNRLYILESILDNFKLLMDISKISEK